MRLFDKYKKRKVVSLDGIWRFKADIHKRGVLDQWFNTFPKDNTDMFVPSCWNNELGLYDYEGIAWYQTTFVNTTENVNLVFHAVTGQAEVYVDGKHLGGHYGGFTGFNFVIRGLAYGEHSLVISVDNTHDDMNTIPLARVDWFHYGGITRSVEVMELGEVWIRNCHVEYKLDKGLENAQLDFSATLEGLDSKVHIRKLNIFIGDQMVSSIPVQIQGQTDIKLPAYSFNGIKLWDIGQPNLYIVRFETEDDDQSERIGFRQICVENRKILLNGKKVFIKGVNRHEDHPDWGFAFPVKLMKKDIEIVKNLGCNSIRGSHYPNSEVFLDYLDQEGILFWEEIPMWGYPEEALKNPLIMERGLKMHEEMVTRDYHHPCIIIWSMHNEIDTRSQAAYDITKAFAEKVRGIDNTRPLSYATMYPLEDICLSLVDIVSINKYFGWYYGKLEDWDTFLGDLKQKMKNEGLENMPVIISEFGAAGLQGECTFEGQKWTENFQDRLFDYTLTLFSNDPDISGTYIWQFCDMQTAKELELGRARSFNNKGILNEYRKPKMAFWTVQRIYRSIK